MLPTTGEPKGRINSADDVLLLAVNSFKLVVDEIVTVCIIYYIYSSLTFIQTVFSGNSRHDMFHICRFALTMVQNLSFEYAIHAVKFMMCVKRAVDAKPGSKEGAEYLYYIRFPSCCRDKNRQVRQLIAAAQSLKSVFDKNTK